MKVDNLNIDFQNGRKNFKFLINCRVNLSISIKGNNRLNRRMLPSLKRLFMNSSENLEKSYLNIPISNSKLKSIFEKSKDKKRLVSVQVTNLNLCKNISNASDCSILIVLKNLKNSANYLEILKIEKYFCFFHTIHRFKNFNFLKTLHLKKESFNSVKTSIEFVRVLTEYQAKIY